MWVIVLNWNGLHHLEYCMPSLLASRLNGARVLVVDNASSDGSLVFLSQYADHQVQVLSLAENRGWAGGNNAGIRYAVGKNATVIVLLNNDVLFSGDWLECALSVFASEPKAGIVGSRLVYSEADLRSGSLRPFSYKPVAHVEGCCLIARSDVFREIGLIDEEYFIYGEEDDLEERAVAAGFELFESSAPVWHKEEGTMAQFPARKSFLAMRNTMLVFRRFRPVWMWPVIVAHIFLCATFRKYRKHCVSNRRYFAGDVSANLLLFGKALWWNLRDSVRRGPRGKTEYPRL